MLDFCSKTFGATLPLSTVYILLSTYDREDIILEENFRTGDFDGFISPESGIPIFSR